MNAKEPKIVLTLIVVLAVSLLIPSCIPLEGGIATAILENGGSYTPTIFYPSAETFTPLAATPLFTTEIYTTNPIAAETLRPTLTPTPTEINKCVLPDAVESYMMTDAGMTCEQIQMIENNKYHLIFSEPGEKTENMYSLGRVETTSAFGITWKFITGFVKDIDPPTPDDGLPAGEFVYFKVEFIDKQGETHEYWLQLDRLGPNKTVAIVITNDLVTDPNALIAAKNAPYPGDRFISDGVVQTDDQWIAQIPVEDKQGRGALRGMEEPEYQQILEGLINALEGNGEFPENIPGFFLPAEGLIVGK